MNVSSLSLGVKIKTAAHLSLRTHFRLAFLSAERNDSEKYGCLRRPYLDYHRKTRVYPQFMYVYHR